MDNNETKFVLGEDRSGGAVFTKKIFSERKIVEGQVVMTYDIVAIDAVDIYTSYILPIYSKVFQGTATKEEYNKFKMITGNFTYKQYQNEFSKKD